MIDLIRDCIAGPELRRNGYRAVWRALFRTACSALIRGWDYSEWHALVGERRSRLGTQAAYRRGRPVNLDRTLGDAWAAAERWLATQGPPFTATDAENFARRVLAFASDPATPLTDTQRAALTYAASVGIKNRTTRPAVPRREVMTAIGKSRSAAVTVMRQLCELGLLELAHRGRPAQPAKGKAGRSALYRLPTEAAINAYLCRGTRPVAPPGNTYGTPGGHPPVPGGHTYGPPTVPSRLRVLACYEECTGLRLLGVHRENFLAEPEVGPLSRHSERQLAQAAAVAVGTDSSRLLRLDVWLEEITWLNQPDDGNDRRQQSAPGAKRAPREH
jgi:hypothetical protein